MLFVSERKQKFRNMFQNSGIILREKFVFTLRFVFSGQRVIPSRKIKILCVQKHCRYYLKLRERNLKIFGPWADGNETHKCWDREAEGNETNKRFGYWGIFWVFGVEGGKPTYFGRMRLREKKPINFGRREVEGNETNLVFGYWEGGIFGVFKVAGEKLKCLGNG